MMPGMNPRDMGKLMKRMGIQQKEIDATEVIIKCSDKEIVIRNPQVAKVNMMGQNTWQVIGEAEERPLQLFNEEDVKTVSEQANVDPKKAREALQKNNGDLVKSILELSKN